MGPHPLPLVGVGDCSDWRTHDCRLMRFRSVVSTAKLPSPSGTWCAPGAGDPDLGVGGLHWKLALSLPLLVSV